MLAACRVYGWPTAGYHFPDHPLQVQIGELIGELAPVIATGVDGCGLPTYAMPLSAMAALLERAPDGASAAMRARPDLVGGAGVEDTVLMQRVPGLLAKRGAEGLLCLVDAEGAGYAFKVEDGNPRAILPAVGAILGLGDLRSRELRNSRGEPVGEISAEV